VGEGMGECTGKAIDNRLDDMSYTNAQGSYRDGNKLGTDESD
jgi:hypothetical protein